MSTTTAKRGSAAKFVALTASLTMIVTGLVGVAVAAPASAADECTALGATQVAEIPVDGQSYNVPAQYQTASYFLLAKAANEGYVKFGPPAPAIVTAEMVGSKVMTGPPEDRTWNGQYSNISNIRVCGIAPEPPTSLTVIKAWEGTNGDASNELAAKLGSADAGTLTVTVNAAATGQAWGASKTGLAVGATAVVSEGAVPELDAADFPTGYTCTVVANNYPKYSANNFALAAAANSVTVTNAVACTQVLPGTTSLKVTKAWVGTNGAESEALAADLRSADAGALTVTVAGAPTGQAWGATKFDLAVGLRVVVSEGAVPALDTADFPTGYTCTVVTAGFPRFSMNEFALATTANTVTVTNGVACTADSTVIENPPLLLTPPLLVNPSVDVTPSVVEAAVAVAPAPVAAPAPMVALAPLPATVEAPAPAAVTVPAAATVPAAVPAGDGSQAPGLPMWALALMVIGALGAVMAGKQIMDARN